MVTEFGKNQENFIIYYKILYLLQYYAMHPLC